MSDKGEYNSASNRCAPYFVFSWLGMQYRGPSQSLLVGRGRFRSGMSSPQLWTSPSRATTQPLPWLAATRRMWRQRHPSRSPSSSLLPRRDFQQRPYAKRVFSTVRCLWCNFFRGRFFCIELFVCLRLLRFLSLLLVQMPCRLGP